MEVRPLVCVFCLCIYSALIRPGSYRDGKQLFSSQLLPDATERLRCYTQIRRNHILRKALKKYGIGFHKIKEAIFGHSELVYFRTEEGEIELYNKSTSAIDIILFGGERYAEPIVAEGPFVMNSRNEIAQAYKDFFDGKYGEIDYEQLSGKA